MSAVEVTTEEADILDLVRYVSKYIERSTGQVFMQRTVTARLDGGSEYLTAKEYPIDSVTSVTDTTTDEVVDPAEYENDDHFLYLTDTTGCHSDTWGRGSRRFLVVYVAGHAEIPADIKLACMALVVFFREQPNQGLNAETIGDYAVRFNADIPASIQNVLASYTIPNF